MVFHVPQKRRKGRFLFFVFLVLCAPFLGYAQTFEVSHAAESEAPRGNALFFPRVYFTEYLEALSAGEAARPYWVEGESENLPVFPLERGGESILLNNTVLAFYGHPLSQNMGILGRYPKEEINEQLGVLAKEYRAAGGRGVCKAFYIVYGTVWPEGEIGILKEAVLKEYIEYALANDILVFIDHQIGKYKPVDALKKMLPYLAYPNVHLALDPEWRTTKPMAEIGTISAEELNQAQQVMEEYLAENRIPGERLLVIHQFNWRMISGRERVKSSFRRVRLVHCADGFGSPNVKRAAYAYNAQAANMPVKGFKLFYDSGIDGHGFDSPLLSPEEVMALDPQPYVVMYQ
ncbi:MAG: hypothetical protein LBF78_14040 [Treponema sp.]|jgi:hypothetical protein|nr:hypothetical protein [Treponema sp.]